MAAGLVPGHGGLTSLEPLASIGIGGISVLENGYEYIYLQRERLFRHNLPSGEVTEVMETGDRVHGERVIVSVGNLDGSIAYPAVMIDPATGEAATLSIAGFVGPIYLS